jgi:hypothetical protein
MKTMLGVKSFTKVKEPLLFFAVVVSIKSYKVVID